MVGKVFTFAAFVPALWDGPRGGDTQDNAVLEISVDAPEDSHLGAGAIWSQAEVVKSLDRQRPRRPPRLLLLPKIEKDGGLLHRLFGYLILGYAGQGLT